MKPRVFLLPILAALVFAPPAWGGEPKAVLRGPKQAAPDAEFWLKLSGSVGDSPVELELADGPEPVVPAVLFSGDGKPLYAVAMATKPGVYTFVVIATGTPDATPGKPKRSYAFAAVTVGYPGPVPPPWPTPGPLPPVPPPTPPPPAGHAWGTLVVPTALTQAQAALRVSPAVRKEFAARGVEWTSYLSSDSQVTSPGWANWLGKAGGLPCLIITDDSGKVLLGTMVNTEADVIAAIGKVKPR